MAYFELACDVLLVITNWWAWFEPWAWVGGLLAGAYGLWLANKRAKLASLDAGETHRILDLTLIAFQKAGLIRDVEFDDRGRIRAVHMHVRQTSTPNIVIEQPPLESAGGPGPE